MADHDIVLGRVWINNSSLDINWVLTAYVTGGGRGLGVACNTLAYDPYCVCVLAVVCIVCVPWC